VLLPADAKGIRASFVKHIGKLRAKAIFPGFRPKKDPLLAGPEGLLQFLPGSCFFRPEVFSYPLAGDQGAGRCARPAMIDLFTSMSGSSEVPCWMASLE
jgi:hypothetical protein